MLVLAFPDATESCCVNGLSRLDSLETPDEWSEECLACTSSVGTGLRVVAYHKRDLGSILSSTPNVAQLSLLVLSSAPRGFSPVYTGFPLSSRTNL